MMKIDNVNCVSKSFCKFGMMFDETLRTLTLVVGLIQVISKAGVYVRKACSTKCRNFFGWFQKVKRNFICILLVKGGTSIAIYVEHVILVLKI